METKYEGHREVRFTDLNVSAAYSVGEEHVSCLSSSPRGAKPTGARWTTKVHFALDSCTQVTPRSLHCVPTLLGTCNHPRVTDEGTEAQGH